MPFLLSRRPQKKLFAILLLLLALLGTQVPFLPLLHAPLALADDDGGDDGDDDGGDDDNNGDDGDDGDDDGGGGSGDDGNSGDDDDSGMGAGDDDDDDDDDHEYAWRERRRGALRSLRSILNRARKRHGGQVLDVKLRRTGNRTWYEIRILDRRDRVKVVRMPATRKRQNFKAGRR